MNYAELLETNPVRAVEKAVKGMLPKNKLAAQQLKKLKVYAGPEPPARGTAAQDLRIQPGRPVIRAYEETIGEIVAQNEEQIVVEEELTSYTSESAAPAAAKAARPALTVAGAAVGRRKEAVARVRVVPGSGNWTINGRSLEDYFPQQAAPSRTSTSPSSSWSSRVHTTSSHASTVVAPPVRQVLCAWVSLVH